MSKSVIVRLKKSDSIESVLGRVRQMSGVIKVEDLPLSALIYTYILQVETSMFKQTVEKLLEDPDVESAYEKSHVKMLP